MIKLNIYPTATSGAIFPRHGWHVVDIAFHRHFVSLIHWLVAMICAGSFPRRWGGRGFENMMRYALSLLTNEMHFTTEKLCNLHVPNLFSLQCCLPAQEFGLLTNYIVTQVTFLNKCTNPQTQKEQSLKLTNKLWMVKFVFSFLIDPCFKRD